MINIKKRIVFFMSLMMMATLVFNSNVQAEELEDLGIDFEYEEVISGYGADPHFHFEKEFIIYVNGVEDTYNIDLNPNYRYIFQWEEPSLARAVCYNCGNSSMTSVITSLVQWGIDDKLCPVAGGAGRNNDLFETWRQFAKEKCSSCGYVSSEFPNGDSYRAVCTDGWNPYPGYWVPEAQKTMSKGYDAHEVLSWWQNKILR